MAGLIQEKPADKYYGSSQDWLFGKDFEITIFSGNENYTFFIEDRRKKLNILDFIPKILKDLELDNNPEISVAPSIDTCGIKVFKSKREEFFKLLESYLLMIEKMRSNK